MRIQDVLDYLRTESIPFSFAGAPETKVDGFSSLNRYKPGSFTWIKTQKNIPMGFDLSQITLVFAAEDVNTGAAPNVIYTPESKRAFFSTMEHFYAQEEERPVIGQFTYISPKVKLGKNVRIGHNCTLDGDIAIGDDTVIWNNVVIVNHVKIGKKCEIQSGTVIGHDGYAYTEDETYRKTMAKHFGGVEIGDSVLLGMGTMIARGTIDDTLISSGTKIDTQCFIAHNCHIGENAALVGKSMLFGSSRLEKNAYLASAKVRNHCTVGENSFVGMGAVVVKDVPANETVVGNPAKPFMK